MKPTSEEVTSPQQLLLASTTSKPSTRPTAVPSALPGLAAGRPEREALVPLSGRGSEQQDPASLSSRGERLRPRRLKQPVAAAPLRVILEKL